MLFTNARNRLECLSLASLFRIVLCLQLRQEPTQVNPLSGASLKGTLRALSTNNIQGWKGLPGANTLAYLGTFVNYDRKKFCNIGPWSKCYETFYGCNLCLFVIY
jgi:hypothetical protein